MTFAMVAVDFMAHRHCDDPKLREEAKDDDFESTLREMGIDPAELAASVPSIDDAELVDDIRYEDSGA